MSCEPEGKMCSVGQTLSDATWPGAEPVNTRLASSAIKRTRIPAENWETFLAWAMRPAEDIPGLRRLDRQGEGKK